MHSEVYRIAHTVPHSTMERKAGVSPCKTSEHLQRLLHDAPHFCSRKGHTEAQRSNLLQQPRGLGVERITGPRQGEGAKASWI
jgi:hypothetical protein